MSTRSIDIRTAMNDFNQAGIDINADFHTLSTSQVQVIVDLAKNAKYRKPDNANGSTARYYFAAIVRQYHKDRA